MLTMQIMIQYHMQLHIQLSQDLVQATDPVVLYVLIWSQVSANEEKNGVFTLFHCLLALCEYTTPTVNGIQTM